MTEYAQAFSALEGEASLEQMKQLGKPVYFTSLNIVVRGCRALAKTPTQHAAQAHRDEAASTLRIVKENNAPQGVIEVLQKYHEYIEALLKQKA